MATRAHTLPRFFLHGFTTPDSTSNRSACIWVGSLTTREIVRRSPRNRKTNFWIVPGLYDGPGGLADQNASMEAHLAKIESDAAIAIRDFSAQDPTASVSLPPPIARFLAWQAARTPGWMKLVQHWLNDPEPDPEREVVEPPPQGFEQILNRIRAACLEDPKTGNRREVMEVEEIAAYRKQGWRLVLCRDDYLEMMHIQAWYFQVRHFPRLTWVRLTAPKGEYFVTSDRGLAWLVDGYADTPPSALRDPSAQIVAPLTKEVALVGRHGTGRLNVTPREVNRFTAFAASNWIAGPTPDVVEQAMNDCLAARE